MANVASPSALSEANYRSVTPSMNNVRRGVGATNLNSNNNNANSNNNNNNMNSGRYVDSFNPPPDSSQHNQQTHQQQQALNISNGSMTPSSTGLIRLTLRKPMGIVFEPMYDPNSPSIQRGVRICDLPRTGAAALSRKLEVGDELLSINDKTMSRLTFDEIMDFIIEADPEEVNLLFRRPRKETLNARHGMGNAVGMKNSSTANGPGVKWIDDEARNTSNNSNTKSGGATDNTGKPQSSSNPSSARGGGGKKDRKLSRRSAGGGGGGGGSSRVTNDDETLQSDDNDYSRGGGGGGGPGRRGRKGRRRKDPYESESFLDILIDTICANPDSVCRDRRRGDEDYYSDDDETFASRDDSTYVTYESEDNRKLKKKLKAKQAKGGKNRDDDSSEFDDTEEDTLEDKRGGPNAVSSKRDKDSSRLSPPPSGAMDGMKLKSEVDTNNKGKYEDDGTLETVESVERAKALEAAIVAEQTPPLGLAPNPEPSTGPVVQADTDDEGNPAPIRELEYDDLDNNDVSVMESLGGPSLLIEKQRQAMAVVQTKVVVPPVPNEIIENFGKDYPLDFGFSRDQTIQNDPLRFYTFVVKGLLQEHEPEKVRLLDKLLAKYRGREDHLVQKLSVRYNKEDDGLDEQQENGLGAARSFEEAVNQNKGSAHANAAIQTARERLQNDDFQADEWPQKETKEADEDDDDEPSQAQSETGTEFSGDSIDGTSPAVIAQVSELLNYVYGKTSVPGQIDRVSTIMRAYEGREAVLLELLETKALIKANREKENAGQLPSFLRNSANAQRTVGNDFVGDVPPVTPMATQAAINDDISSMSGVSSPAEGQQNIVNGGVLKQISGHETAPSTKHVMNVDASIGHEVELPTPTPTPSSQKTRPVRTSAAPEKGETKKKKKGIFGGLFGGKKGKKSKDGDKSERTASRSRGLRSPMARKAKNSSETSI